MKKNSSMSQDCLNLTTINVQDKSITLHNRCAIKVTWSDMKRKVGCVPNNMRLKLAIILMSRIGLSFSLSNHNTHPHLVSPEPWLCTPALHWSRITIHYKVTHLIALQHSISFSLRFNKVDSLSYPTYLLLTCLFTSLLCPLQRLVLLSPVPVSSSLLQPVSQVVQWGVCFSLLPRVPGKTKTFSHVLISTIISILNFIFTLISHPLLCCSINSSVTILIPCVSLLPVTIKLCTSYNLWSNTSTCHINLWQVVCLSCVFL